MTSCAPRSTRSSLPPRPLASSTPWPRSGSAARPATYRNDAQHLAGNGPFQADTAEPALPGRWCRPLGGGAEGASGGTMIALDFPAVLAEWPLLLRGAAM